MKKETQAQVFSCKFSQTFKYTFFYRTPPVAASENIFFETVRISFELSTCAIYFMLKFILS